MKKPKSPEPDLELAAFRMPKELRAKAKEKARRHDMTFSQLMRRALRNEIAGGSR
jgi:hypothetical protein